MIVPYRGIIEGSDISVFLGGHVFPISMLGDKELFKYIQNRDVNNRISDIMNRINLVFNIFSVCFECMPIFEFSDFVFITHMVVNAVIEYMIVDVLIIILFVFSDSGMFMRKAFIIMVHSTGMLFCFTR